MAISKVIITVQHLACLISCEIQTPYEGLDGTLLDKNGKLTM